MTPRFRRGRGTRTARDEEAAKYRRAAEAALEQIDACIEYLRRIRKGKLAAQLTRNRNSIKRLLR